MRTVTRHTERVLGRPLTVAFDQAWGACGWCVANSDGPLEAGVRSLDGAGALKWAKLTGLIATVDAAVARCLPACDSASHMPVLAIEKPPMIYAAKARRSDAAVIWALGNLAGALQLHWTRPDWSPPWEVEAEQWRRWWGIRQVGREAQKSMAVQLVRLQGWGRLIDRVDEAQPPSSGTANHGPSADVAEAILLAVGVARHRNQSPKPPRSFEAIRDGTLRRS